MDTGINQGAMTGGRFVSAELIAAIDGLLGSGYPPHTEQRRVIVTDLLWKLARKDYHGVADCAMDLRELHL